MSIIIPPEEPDYSYSKILHNEINVSNKQTHQKIETSNLNIGRQMSMMLRNIAPEDIGNMYITPNAMHTKKQTFIKEIYYTNRILNKDIYIQEPNNLIFKVEGPKSNYDDNINNHSPVNYLIITERYKFGSREAAEECRNTMTLMRNDTTHMNTNIDAKALLSILTEVLGPNTNDKFNYYKNIGVKEPYSGTYANSDSIYVEIHRIVTYDQLKECDRLYISNLGIVLSLNKELYNISHPNSVDSARWNTIGINTPKPHNSYELRIDLIDNDNTIKSKYTYVLGKLIKLKPTEDLLRPNGLYVEETINGIRINNKRNHYEFNELIECKLYNTADEAITQGDPSIIIERIKHEKAFIEAENAKSTTINKATDEEYKRENDLLKIQYEREKMRSEKEKETMKMEFEKERLNAEIKKLEHDKWNNIFKAVVAALATTATGITLWNKYVKEN